MAGSPVRIGPETLARAALLTCGHFLPVGRARQLLEALTGIDVSTGFLAGIRGRVARNWRSGSCPTCEACWPLRRCYTSTRPAVRRMAFVLAADEDLIREAIGIQLEGAARGGFAKLYTEKIIQLPISLPVLSVEQAEAYIALLLCKNAGHLTTEQFQGVIDAARERRLTATRDVPSTAGRSRASPRRPAGQFLNVACTQTGSPTSANSPPTLVDDLQNTCGFTETEDVVASRTDWRASRRAEMATHHRACAPIGYESAFWGLRASARAGLHRRGVDGERGVVGDSL